VTPDLRRTAGEWSIRAKGKGGAHAGIGVYLALILGCLLVFAGCGSDESQAPVEPAQSPETSTAVSVPADGNTEVGAGQAEATSDEPFKLNTDQPVPPNFEEAYGRRARIVVQFYKLDEDSLSYPQGLSVDRKVNASMERLASDYPDIEFFSYEITNPGPVGEKESLQPGEYGTLAAQLGVGITPFVAMLAPNGDEYVITNLFEGYVPRPVLSQALFDLAAVEVEDNTSDVDVTLEQVQTTDKGGGIEYFTVHNDGDESVNLSGFSLRVLDPENAQVEPGAPGVIINEDVMVKKGESVSIGRVPDVVDDEGKRVTGTFEGGTSLDLAPGDQIALLDTGGAVASTISI